MSKLMGLIRPINFSSRDGNFYGYLRTSQSLTSQELLEIDFGGPLPKGINQAAPNTKKITIKNFFQDKASSPFMKPVMSLMAAGYVREPDARHQPPYNQPYERAVHINNLMISPVGQAGLGWMVKGIAVSGAKIAAAGSLSLLVQSYWMMLVMACSSLRFAPLVQLGAFIWKPAMDTVGHEHMHVLQGDDLVSGKTGFDALGNFFRNRAEKQLSARADLRHKADRAASLFMVGYFMNDYEIQARLHVVIVHGAKRWGRVPQTKHELWAALIDSGLNAPQTIRDELAQSAEAGVNDFRRSGLKSSFNRAARGATDPSASEINIACRALILPDLKEDFWTGTLPYLYGHMVELYGDPDGRKRMGYDPRRPVETIFREPAGPS